MNQHLVVLASSVFSFSCRHLIFLWQLALQLPQFFSRWLGVSEVAATVPERSILELMPLPYALEAAGASA